MPTDPAAVLAMPPRPATLLPAQRAALARFGASDQAGLLLEMRLGKTLAAVRWALCRFQKRGTARRGRILVVAPTTPLVSWEQTLASEGEPYALAVGSAARRSQVARDQATRWTLTTYHAFWRTPEILRPRPPARPWDAVILDEATAIKSPRSQCTKAALKHLVQAPLRAILTGEIQPQSLFDVWCPMAFLGGGRFMGFGNFWKWRDAVGYRAGFEWDVKARWRPKIKEAVHRDALVLTRDSPGISLPGGRRTREVRQGEMDPAARRAYARVFRDWASGGRETKVAAVVANWLRQIAGGHAPGASVPCWKVREVVGLLTGELARESAVVFFVYNRELARVWRALRNARVSGITWLAGEVPLEERARRIRLFSQGRRRVMLAQVKCARMGIDLSAADTAIYYSSPWSFEDRRQSEFRIESALKSTTTLIVDLVTRDSVDEAVQETMLERRTTSKWFAERVLEREEGRAAGGPRRATRG